MCILDCAGFNFKYINNCSFVFHAVGERELIHSFSRVLSTKRERIEAAVIGGFVAGGVQLLAEAKATSWQSMDPTNRLVHACGIWNRPRWREITTLVYDPCSSTA